MAGRLARKRAMSGKGKLLGVLGVLAWGDRSAYTSMFASHLRSSNGRIDDGVPGRPWRRGMLTRVSGGGGVLA